MKIKYIIKMERVLFTLSVLILLISIVAHHYDRKRNYIRKEEILSCINNRERVEFHSSPDGEKVLETPELLNIKLNRQDESVYSCILDREE